MATVSSLKDFLDRSERFLAALRKHQNLFSAKATPRVRHLVDALALDGQFPDRSEIVRPGLFAHLRRSESGWAYLLLAGIPQTSAQVAAALARGRVKSQATDELRATQAMLSYGLRVGRLRRYGLRHWTINLDPAKARTQRRALRAQLRVVVGGRHAR